MVHSESIVCPTVVIVPAVVQESLSLRNGQSTSQVVVGVGQSIEFHVTTIYGKNTEFT